jgi:diguanylate cyclase (GGDEF)-like protein
MASLIAPAMVIVQVARGELDDVVATASVAAVLFLLVMGRMVGLVRDLESALAQRRALQAQLKHNAHHDDLTGLVNRRRFTERVDDALRRRVGGGTCVMFLDLDRFKTVNDSLGHTAGDSLLVVTAERLRTTLQPGDTAARLGGDEFAVLLEGEPTAAELAETCATLTRALAETVPMQGLDLTVSASIGSARARPGDTFEDLLHRADVAMYAQKASVDRRRTKTAPPTAVPAPRSQ